MPLPESAIVSRTCLRDEAYARLRDWILDGTLAPDEPLRDESLAEALGMSRTPVREAVQRLEDEGFAITTSNRRTYVSPVSLQQAREIFPMVEALEELALQLAINNLDEQALDAMGQVNATLAEALVAGDTAKALTADTALHGVFIEHSHSHELVTTLAELKYKVRRIERAFWGSADRSASVRDHEQLIRALSQRDLTSARRLLIQNWKRGFEWLNPELPDHA